MRFPEGLVVDTEKTLGELKFAALRRENYAQDEEGNVTDEIKKRTYDLKCQRQGHTITVSIPPEAGEKAFPVQCNGNACKSGSKCKSGCDVRRKGNGRLVHQCGGYRIGRCCRKAC